MGMRLLALVAAWSLGLACGAAAAQDKGTKAKAAPVAPPAAVEYRPPARGAPKVRVGGSTRGMNRALSLAVIAPDHTGLSSGNQPELFWYISRPVETPLEFVLAPAEGGDAIVEKAIPPVAEAGIQRIRVADLGVKLEPGREYQWLISLASKPNSKAKDAIAGGRVRVEPLPQEVAQAVRAAGASGAYAAYAQAGYWYDAVSGLRREMARRPKDAALADAQRSLLEQVGLNEVARVERERGR